MVMEPLVQKILREGVQSLKVDMLPPQMKLRLLTEAGDKLLHANHLQQAAATYVLAGNIDKLRETDAWFLEQKRHGHAAIFLKHVGTPTELNRLAEECIAGGDVLSAKMIYKELNDEPMLAFLEENFTG